MDDEERGYSAPDGTREPDGWVLLHGEVMVFGPLPRRDWMVQVMATWDCTCTKEIRPIWFAPGVIMAMDTEYIDDPLGTLKRVH